MKKDLFRIGIALIVVVLLFGGLFWWLGPSRSSDEDCINLSELNEDELWQIIESRVDQRMGNP